MITPNKTFYLCLSLTLIIIPNTCSASEIVLSCIASMNGVINGKKSHAEQIKFGFEISDATGVLHARTFGNLAFVIGGEEWNVKEGSCASDTYPICNGSVTIGDADILIREERHAKWAKDKSSDTYHDQKQTEVSINRYTGALEWKISEADWSGSSRILASTQISGNCIPEKKRMF